LQAAVASFFAEASPKPKESSLRTATSFLKTLQEWQRRNDSIQRVIVAAGLAVLAPASFYKIVQKYGLTPHDPTIPV